ncbi:MAG: DUF1290 domain-containing protein [Saccharofermentanales bacterium]
MLIIFGLLVGLLFGLFTNIALPASLVPYLAVFTLVGIEALTGSWNSMQEGDFDPVRFLVEFAVNTAAAVLITALGNQMKYDFSMIVSFIFAYRIFRNINFITRKLYLDMRKRRKGAVSPPHGEEDGRKS